MTGALRPGSVKSFISMTLDRIQSALQHKVSELEPTRQEQHDEWGDQAPLEDEP